MKKLRVLNQNGSVLLALVLILPSLILITSLYLQLTVSSLRVAQKDQLHTHAQLATDAGIDRSLYEINRDATWAGTGTEIELHNDGSTKTTYQVTAMSNGPDNKIVTSTGRSYRPASSTTPESFVTVKVDLRAVKAGNFSIVTGVGGLFMTNRAKIVGGDVFVNGEIDLRNSAQIGLTTNSVKVDVAHQNCPNPPDATYPRTCNPGENGEPISFRNRAHIYGTVKANNQISGTDMSNPGLVASSGVAAQPLPPHDRDAQKAAVTTTITGAAASCSDNETRTWAANTKITGDVTVTNRCDVTVLGNVWITGTLETRNSTQVIVSDALGATQPVIMIDGVSAEFNNRTLLKSNASGTGFQIITYKSNAACSPDCASVTGIDLYNSRNLTTIDLDNSAAGPNTVFYARWSRVTINNRGQIGALVGQTIALTNSGTITFGTSVPGSGTTFWIIDGYRRNFN